MMQNGSNRVSNPWAGKSDAEVVLAARGGDKGAFVEIVARHQTMVCGIAFGVLNDFAASEDAAQEAFFTAWRKLGEIRDVEHLRGWLAQIARNAALANLRRRRPEAPLPDDCDRIDHSPSPDDAAATKEDYYAVRKALGKLPEQFRLPLVLFYFEGHSTRAVAESLGLSDDVIRQRLSRGREMLRSHMEGVVETVLQRRRPTALFTMTIAAGIGALAAPPTVAAAAFASGYSPVNSFLSAMSGSKALITSAAAIILVSMPIGYQLGPIYSPPKPQTNSTLAKVTPITAPPVFDESELLAEWRALHEKHGTTADSMPFIYDAIKALNDPFRQSAFTAALIAEWTELNPHAAVAFFSDKSRPHREREQLFQEWFAAAPRQALTTVPDSQEWHEILKDSLKEVAVRFPEMVVDIVQRQPKKENFYDESIKGAFGVLAERDLKSARETAERLDGSNQQDALAGVAQVWARTDLDAAIAWAQEMNVDADEVIRSALVGVASVNPLAALTRISSIPPGGRETHGNSTTGARVLQAAAGADFETTITWLNENPAGLSREDLLGLRESVTERLLGDGTDFLTRHANDGSISVLVEAIESALMNRAAGMRPAVWEWLKNQAPSDAVMALRTSVLDSSAWHDPEFALELVKDLPETSRGDADVEEVARALLNGGHEIQRFEKLYETAPERLREPLVEQAFGHLSADYMDDPHVWLKRVSLLRAEKRVEGIVAVARAWASNTPEEAALWAMSQPSGNARISAIRKIASTWAARDEGAVRLWLETLPADERSQAEADMKEKEKQ
jgi:RNA polymerase sigma factor (sigma-70 family)